MSFGGGYAAMPLIKEQVVEQNKWLGVKEFADIVTISQMTPGPIAINSASFVGVRVGGIPGALVATMGCVLPSCIIVLALAFLYYKYRGLDTVNGILKGLRPAIISLILSAAVSLTILSVFNEGDIKKGINVLSSIIFVAAFLIIRKWDINPIKIILFSGVAGLFYFVI